jgi:hypothetical protein
LNLDPGLKLNQDPDPGSGLYKCYNRNKCIFLN